MQTPLRRAIQALNHAYAPDISDSEDATARFLVASDALEEAGFHADAMAYRTWYITPGPKTVTKAHWYGLVQKYSFFEVLPANWPKGEQPCQY